MNKKEINHPDKQADTGAYAAAIRVDDWLYISGQGPLDLTTGQVIPGTIEEETVLTLSHIRKIVEAAGGSMEHIIKCTVHLGDINDFEKFNQVYSGFFPGIKPARTTVQSGLSGGIKIEIDAIAKL